MDVDNIPAGQDFVDELSRQVSNSSVFLCVIGKTWLDAADETTGLRKLDLAHDFVRIEIEAALQQGCRIIPVLVNSASVPREEDLPEAIRPLARRNAVRLTHERFKSDSAGLISAIESSFQQDAADEEKKRRDAEETKARIEREGRARLEAMGALSPEHIEMAQELLNWELIKSSTRSQDFRDHLARFPRGACQGASRARLELLEWQELGPDAGIQALSAFVDEFPTGIHSEIAKTQLASKLEKQKWKALGNEPTLEELNALSLSRRRKNNSHPA